MSLNKPVGKELGQSRPRHQNPRLVAFDCRRLKLFSCYFQLGTGDLQVLSHSATCTSTTSQVLPVYHPPRSVEWGELVRYAPKCFTLGTKQTKILHYSDADGIHASQSIPWCDCEMSEASSSRLRAGQSADRTGLGNTCLAWSRCRDKAVSIFTVCGAVAQFKPTCGDTHPQVDPPSAATCSTGSWSR